jgi:hypothetical protein
MRHQIARVGEAREIPDFGDQGDDDDHCHAAQRQQSRHYRRHRPFRDLLGRLRPNVVCRTRTMYVNDASCVSHRS